MILQAEYSFKCNCEACSKNFPLFHALKSFDKKLLKQAKKEKNEIFKSDAKTARKKLPDICDLIQSSSSSAQSPSTEIILLQESLQQCLAIITKPKIYF